MCVYVYNARVMNLPKFLHYVKYGTVVIIAPVTKVRRYNVTKCPYFAYLGFRWVLVRLRPYLTI